MFRRPSARSAPAGPSEGAGRLDLAPFRRLLGYTRPYAWRLVLALVASSIGSLLFLAFPVVVGDLFNNAFGAGSTRALTGWAVDLFGGSAGEGIGGTTPADLNAIALVLIAVFALNAATTYVRVYQLGHVGEGVVADLRRELFRHLLGLSTRFFETRPTGEITSRLTSDIATIQAAVSNVLVQLVSQSVSLVGGVVVLFVINARLTLVMLAVLPAVIVAAAVFGRRLRKISTAFQDELAAANARAEEAISGIRVVQSFTAERHEADRYGEAIRTAFASALRRARVRALFVPSVFTGFLMGIGLVLWYGGRLALAGDLPPGDLITFLLLTVTVAGSIGAFTGLYSQVQEAAGASRRVFELLDARSDLPEPARPTALDAVRGEVRFEGVRFRYGDRGDAWVLDGIDLVANPGEVVALVGPSGAGKSTLVTLVPRFFDPVEGRVTLDGVDLRELDPHDLRHHVGVVPQETLLFSGSIAENVRYGRPNASDEEVVAAAVAANADAFVREFPDGYGTLVGERGVKLSGGQRQRIAIARALLKDPRILVLDEATSSLDSESEALVQVALERLMEGRTTFVIAHRLSTVVDADRIVVLDAGRIVQVGRHAELLAEGGLYRDLYEIQFRDVDA
ncbi:MAG: ABC transporter transmembrane domain-containing protein [Trueperaceae bacterium]|nr:ABC transporter transmembrane domain-containing protein [Trueperaceae bacterium]